MHPQQPYPQQPHHPYVQQGSGRYPHPQQGGWQPAPSGPSINGYAPPISQQPWPPTPPAQAKKRRKWPWILLVILVLLVLLIVSATKNKTPSSPTAGTSQSAATAPDDPAQQTPASPPTDYSGKGDDVVTIKKDSGPAIVTFECPRCSRNTVLQSDGADTLLVNAIGSYSGRQLIDAMDGSSTSTLTVKATGSWKITVASGLASAKRGDTSATGRGDDVVLLTASISKAAITNKGGSSNFVVRAYESSGSFPNLAVNTIGGYSGTVPIHGPAVLAIMSTGSWTINGS
jgi:hypothetical protein